MRTHQKYFALRRPAESAEAAATGDRDRSRLTS
jgi:hypothetical protein